MKTIGMALAVLGLLASPALTADKKLEEAVAKAEAQLEKGKADEALKGLQKTATGLGTSEAFVALSRFQIRLGSPDNTEGAAAAAQKAVDASATALPEAKADALANLSDFDLMRGSGGQALSHAQEAIKAQEGPGALATLARAQVRVGNAAAALTTAQKAVQTGPSSGAAHAALGEALLASGKKGEATAAFSKALELDPKLTASRVGMAEALLAQGKAAEAAAEARKATEYNKGSAEAYAVLASAIFKESKGNWAKAIEEAQQGAFVNPKSAVAQVAVGRLFEANANLDQASNAYREALKNDPSYLPARMALIRVQIQKGDNDAAVAELQKLIKDAPNSAEAHLQMGRLLLRKNDFAAALPALVKAVDLDGGNGEAQAMLGTAYQYNKKTNEAVAAYKKAVELSPQALEYKVTYGLLLGLTDDYEAGIAELQKAIQGGFKDSAVWVNLGWVYRNMEPPKGDESVAAYRKALELEPKSAQAALGLGWALILTRGHEDALIAFKKAIDSDPKTAGEALAGTAWVYYFKKDMAQAKETLAKAQAAGRNDLRLKDAIAKYEEALQKGREEAEKRLAQQSGVGKESSLEALTIQLKSKNAAVRVRAADALGAAGPDAVPHLDYALGTDADWGVREASARSLGRIGAAARAAVPRLVAVAGIKDCQAATGSSVIATPEKLAEELKCEDAKRAARDALARIPH